MAGTYRAGEEKVRPGVYRRYTAQTTQGVAGAMTGVFAIPVHADFGPLRTVTTHTKFDTVKELYGEGGTVKGVQNLFKGGAVKVFVYRLGTEVSTETEKRGVCQTLELQDENRNENDKTIVILKTKYPTAISFTVDVKEKPANETKKQFCVYQGAVLKETLEYEVKEGADEAEILTELVNKQSAIFTAEKSVNEAVSLSNIAIVEVQSGSNPKVTVEDYDLAFAAFEAYKWNILVADTTSEAVQASLKAYMERIKENGAIGSCVVGGRIDTVKSTGTLEDADISDYKGMTFEERLNQAKSFNSEYFIYAGSGYVDEDGNRMDGYEAITMQAGIIGSTPSNQSVVHTVIPGAVDTMEVLRNEDYIKAIENGMLMLSPSEDGQVWFDSGVTTLTDLKENQDAGWKKIRRTMTRYEMFDRIDRTITPLIGKVNCDADGIANIVKVAKDVLNAMVREGKLKDGADFYEDSEYPMGEDNVHFIIAASDVDSLEKIYLNYQFSFTAE